MKISEAVKIALSEGKCIKRTTWGLFVEIKPTNGNKRMAIVLPNGKQTPRWNPHASDLLAEDWEVTE